MGLRFVSPYGRYCCKIRKQKIELLADGSYRELLHGLYAQFQENEYNEREREAAYQRFGSQIHMGARFEDQYLTVPASQEWRIGTFDTAWIDDPDDRKLVEEGLLSHRKNGIDFIQVERVRIQPPWPAYDKVKAGGRGRTNETVALEIAEKVQEDGHDVGMVIAYERENQNRPEVIAALEALTVEDAEPEEIEVAA